MTWSSLRFAARRRPRCWLMGHEPVVWQTGQSRALVVCGRCLQGEAPVPLVVSPRWQAAQQAEQVAVSSMVDASDLALRLVSAAVDGEPDVVSLARSVGDQPLAASLLAAWLAGLLGKDFHERRTALAALSLKVQLDRLGS